MPEGSYLSQDTPGRMGNSMKSVAMADSAQKSAVMEIRFVDQPCAWSVVEWLSCLVTRGFCAMVTFRFSHPDYNRWSWNPTRSTAVLVRLADSCGTFLRAPTASGESHPALKLEHDYSTSFAARTATTEFLPCVLDYRGNASPEGASPKGPQKEMTRACPRARWIRTTTCRI